MYEFIAADDDGDVRHARVRGPEEHEVPRRQFARIDGLSLLELIAHVARQGDPVQSEDILREPAAVEAIWITPAVAIRRPAKRQRGQDQ